jgi:L-threonylcarbamoyladenylate synthase
MYAIITKDILIAKDIIKSGRVVAFPTGTTYGLAVDALQGHALQRLRNLKQRPKNKSFTIFLKESLYDKFLDITKEELSLIQKNKNQPLTLLVKPKEPLRHLEKDTLIGLRIIDHPLMAQLAEAVDVPLTATSANISGSEACLSIDCITKQFPGLLDPQEKAYGNIEPAGQTTYDLSLGCILDGGNLPTTKPSTIAKIINGNIQVIREGIIKM